MSVIHPGSSINFDAATLHQNEDDEMIQEELRQQKELRELLSAELSDDLLDDDHSSVNDSHRSLRQDDISQEDVVNSPVITSVAQDNQTWYQGGNPVASYENSSIPMSSTPGEPLNQYYGQQTNGYGYDARNPYGHGNYEAEQRQYYEPSYGDATSQPQQWQGQLYGNEMMYPQQRNDGVGQYMHYDQNQMHIGRVGEDRDFPFSERREVEGREDYEAIVDGNRPQQQFIQYKPNRPGPSAPSNSMASQGSKASYRQSYPPQSSQHGRSNGHQYRGYDTSVHDVSVESSPAHHDKQDSNMFQEFNNATKDVREEGERQVAQLQILYKARGKKLDELTRELESLKSDAAREKRILSHQLAMAKDQKDGMGTSLEGSQRLLQSKDREIEDLRGKLDTEHAEVESLKNAKNELLGKIQVSERTIEGLHEQLTQMSHSETMERAREQHDAVLNAATQRHEMQILESTTQLDECRQELNDKNEEMEKLHSHLNKVTRESEQTLLDKTETINRLTQSLEEAQNQCQGLLAGSSENAFNRHQMNDLVKDRERNEEEIAYLKMQLREAEEHLTLFENALQLGAGRKKNHHTRGGSLSDSLSELVIGRNDVVKKLDWKTPQIMVKESENGGQEELIDGLRRELERALSCNKAKRDQVTKLQQQCSELEKESTHWRSRADEVKEELKMQSISTPKRKKSTEEEDQDSLAIQDLEEKLRIAEDEIERYQKMCSEVKQRMAEMIQEHDQDKQDAVDRCERACMQLHEDAKQALRDELVSAQEQKLYEISVEHDAKMRELNADMEQLQHELYDVKQSYVHICTEKDNIQSTCQQELLDEFEQQKTNMLSEHEQAIKNLEEELGRLEKEMKEKINEAEQRNQQDGMNEREKMVQELRTEWEKERDEDFAQQIETKIALAKVNWFEEFSSSKQKAINAAVQEDETKWTERMRKMQEELEESKEEEWRNKMTQEEEKWKREKEAELEKLRCSLQKEKEDAVKTASRIAELNMAFQKESMQGEKEDLLEEKLQEAKNIWKQEEEERMKQARESWRAEQDKHMQDAMDDVLSQKKEDVERERQTQKVLMEKAVCEVKKVCDQEKQVAIKQKCADMEKEITKLQQQHKQDYEKFVEDHKRTLATFLEQERERTSSSMQNASTQAHDDEKSGLKEKERSWERERNRLVTTQKEEIAALQSKFREKCDSMQAEIQTISRQKQTIADEMKRLESKGEIEVERAVLNEQRETSMVKLENEKLRSEVADADSKLQTLREQNKSDIDRLKDRMREEYRRWKKERSSLIAKLKNTPHQYPNSRSDGLSVDSTPRSENPCQACQTSRENSATLLKHKDEASRKAILELSNMYADTLKLIKDEMMSHIGESRGRTKETIARERRRTAAKMKTHYIRAMQKTRAESDLHQQLVQKLKVFESDSGSRVDTPFLSSQKSTERVAPAEEREVQAPGKVSAPRATQADRFQAWREEAGAVPTKLAPERDAHVGGRSAFVRPAHPHLPRDAGRGRPALEMRTNTENTPNLRRPVPAERHFSTRSSERQASNTPDYLRSVSAERGSGFRHLDSMSLDRGARDGERGTSYLRNPHYTNYHTPSDSASLGATYHRFAPNGRTPKS